MARSSSVRTWRLTTSLMAPTSARRSSTRPPPSSDQIGANRALVSRNARVAGGIPLPLLPQHLKHTFERLPFFGQSARDAVGQRVGLGGTPAEDEDATQIEERQPVTRPDPVFLPQRLREDDHAPLGDLDRYRFDHRRSSFL